MLSDILEGPVSLDLEFELDGVGVFGLLGVADYFEIHILSG